MAEVRRRRVEAAPPPVARRRDRVTRPVEEDEEADVDATVRPARTRRATPTRPATKRREAPVAEEPDEEPDEELADDDDDADYYDADPEEDDDAEEDEAPRRSPARAARKRPEPLEEEDEEDPAPVSSRDRARGTGRLPSGIRVGLAGAEETLKAGGSGTQRVALSKEPTLIKCLENEPFASFRQHWVPSGPGQPDRPYVCEGREANCPLCDYDPSPSASYCFNVLVLSAESEPQVKMLQIATKAFEAFKEAATPRDAARPRFDRDFWTVTRSGTGQQSQTNFRPVKERDLADDWKELLETFYVEDLPVIIKNAKKHLFDAEKAITQSTHKQLLEVAKYFAED